MWGVVQVVVGAAAMTLTDEQKRWITWGCGEIRRTTHGCGTWDQPGTHKAITDILGTWTFLAAMDHAFAHARDPKARTPYAMRGSKPNLEPATTARFPMRAGDPDECRTHRGQHRDHCSGCAADQKAADDMPAGFATTTSAQEAIAACRAALKTGRQETTP